MPRESGHVDAPPIRVVKIGGSLASDPSWLRALLRDLAADEDHACVVVPGGGAFANAVRQTQDAFGFDDGLAHRLALDAMIAMAQVFRAVEPRLILASSAAAVRTALRERLRPIWAPRDIRDGHPDIPEVWDVTSDSLALWLATNLRAESCVLIKSIDAPEPCDPTSLARCGFVDRAFPGFADAYAGRIILRGPTRETALARGTCRNEVAA